MVTKVYTFILNRILPNLRIINVILLMIFGICLWKIHFLVDKPHILSAFKLIDFGKQRFYYKCLLDCLLVFNAWLVFYPICRSIYIYRALLKLEVIGLSFDLLLIFVSFIFTYVIVYGFFTVDSFLLMLNMHLRIDTPDIDLYLYTRELALREHLNVENIRLDCSTCNQETNSSGGSGSSTTSPEMLVISPMEKSPPVSGDKPCMKIPQYVMAPGQSVGAYTGPNGEAAACTDVCEDADKTFGQIADMVAPKEKRTTVQNWSVSIGKRGIKDACQDLIKNTGSGVVCTTPMDVAAPGTNPEDLRRAAAYHEKMAAVLKEKADKAGK